MHKDGASYSKWSQTTFKKFNINGIDTITIITDRYAKTQFSFMEAEGFFYMQVLAFRLTMNVLVWIISSLYIINKYSLNSTNQYKTFYNTLKMLKYITYVVAYF